MSRRTQRVIRVLAILNGALVLIVLAAALFGEGGVARRERLAEELRRMEALNADLRTKNAERRAEAGALRHDADYVEHVIRDELGWVRDDELIFMFPSSEGQPK